jgi:hypothetical protein
MRFHHGTLAVVLAIIASLSCTKTVTMQPSDYEEHGSGLLYRVHMRSGCTYPVASFTANDSTIVVKSLHYTGKPGQCVQSTPFEIKRQDIASIEKVEPGIGMPIVVITLLALIALAGFATVAGGD